MLASRRFPPLISSWGLSLERQHDPSDRSRQHLRLIYASVLALAEDENDRGQQERQPSSANDRGPVNHHASAAPRCDEGRLLHITSATMTAIAAAPTTS